MTKTKVSYITGNIEIMIRVDILNMRIKIAYMKVSLGTISFMGKEGYSIDQIIMNIKDNGLKTRKMDMDAKQQG